MRTLAITQNLSADGSPEFLGDWFDPTTPAPDLNAEVLRQSEAEDILLLGRQTFEDFRGYWPQHADEPAGAYLDQVQKYVVSSSMTDAQWHNSTILSGDPIHEVRRLKDSDGRDITLSGSITLAHAALAAGLVDEIRLLIYPAVQGRGRGLVPEGTSIPHLELLESQAFRSGVVLLRYAVTHG
jgi:dihydrofolate reductase